ncbi:MAG: sensor histidine kinase [Candidatus Omnitrophica bacterium]|nr:sensor histidine kinase [Candidatus Omnitrophota bacterium]MBI3083588.1 sensor histidine kinase [Candidatus Omnitrophota bacterium]
MTLQALMSGYRGERRLVAGFVALLVLTMSIGLISVSQIQSLARAIQAFGQQHLPIERSILAMKTTNTLYTMGVRNYVFWRTSRYLQAVSIASDIQAFERASQDFLQSLRTYRALTASAQQRTWADQLEGWVNDLQHMGREIMQLADAEDPDRDRVNRLLMVFEQRAYRIEEFLARTLSQRNLEAIDRQVILTNRQRRAALLVLALSVSCSLILGTTIARFVYASLREERRLRGQLVQRMITLEEEERKNLSRQLHDQLSQDLSALKIYLGLIDQDLPPEMTEQRERLQKSKTLLAGLIERGHNISELLRPSGLDQLGLVESIAALATQHEELTGYRYRFQRPVAEPMLSGEHRLVLYRVAQEALTNIAKHANAKHKEVHISLRQTPKGVCLTIVDEGVGFNYDALLRQPRRRKEDTVRLGLLGLRERVELVGGTFTIDAAPGKGTKLAVEVPV